MREIEKHIVVDLTGYRLSVVDVSQGDRQSRAVSCRLMENGAPWIIPDGARVLVSYLLPDGTEGSYDTMPDGSPAGHADGNIVKAKLIDQLTVMAGAVEMSIVVLGAQGEQLSVWPVRLNVIGPDKMTIPENLPPLGAGYEGKLLYGGPGGALIPLGVGTGVRVERREDGSLWLVSDGSGGGISEETDPTVPAWAKQPQKPSYTATEVGLGNVANERQYSSENPPPYPVTSVNGKSGTVELGAADVGALPEGTKIPVKISDLSNDAGFVDRAVSDLENYYTQAQTRELIAAIPKFRVTVVQQLPDTGEELVLYLVPFATAQGQYLEYIWADNQWEVIGSQQVDLTGYATETYVQQTIPPAVNDALEEAKRSGEFDGEDGITPHIGDNGNWFSGDTDTGVPATGPQGPAGADGKTPVAGVDYFTADDKAEMVQAVIAALPKYAGEVV